jgi:glycosyltransferase involved in cell wall biosynthesis
MKVSIIVTNFNYEKWIRRCIRSLLNQNFDSYEIIIVDDLSTDNSRDILLEYKDHPKVKLIFNEYNMGVGASSTIGAKKALGKYIIRVDADDYVNNSFINILYLCSSLNNYDAVACDYQEVDFKENVLSTKSQKEEPLACGIIYRTDILEYLNFWNSNLRINEDIDMIKRFKKEFKIKYLNIPLYRYFKHSNSLSVGR